MMMLIKKQSKFVRALACEKSIDFAVRHIL